MADKVKQIQEEPFKSLLILALPIILLLIFNESYTILDTYFLSQLGNSVVIAFGYIVEMFYFINRLGKGIGRGVSSIIARHIGANDYESINNIALHGIILIIIISIASQIIFAFSADQIIHFYVKNDEYSLIKIYLQCLFLFIVSIFMSEYLVEMLNGEGDTRLSTAVMSLGVALNIILDYIFIFPCNMGMFGGSLGTCIAYVITTVIFLYIYLIRKDHIIKFKIADFSFDWAIIREILKNAVPIILDSLAATLSGLYLIASLRNFAPDITVVAFLLILRIQMFLFTPIQGLSRSCNIIVGHLFGAQRYRDAKNQMNKSILVSFLMNGAIALILVVFLNVILAFFTKQHAVMAEVRNILYIVILDLIIFSVVFNSNQSLIAIGCSPSSFYSVIIRFLSLAVSIYLLCNICNCGKFGVLISLILSDMVQATYSYLAFIYHISKARNRDCEEITP